MTTYNVGAIVLMPDQLQQAYKLFGIGFVQGDSSFNVLNIYSNKRSINPDPVVFILYDSSGNPLPGQLTAGMPLNIVTYKTLAGVNRTKPTITDIGGGLYQFTPSSADATIGTAFEINCGSGASPSRINGSVGSIIAWGVYNSINKLPQTGLFPFFSKYETMAGADAPPHPTIVEIGGGLYGFQPLISEYSAGRAWNVTNGGLPVDSGGDFIISSSLTPLNLLSVTSTENVITITFDSTIVANSFITNPANWVISGGHYNIVVTNVTIVGAVITLNTTNMVNGIPYTLNIPTQDVFNTSGVYFAGTHTQVFTPSGSGPDVLQIQIIDSRTIQVIFERPVNELDAMNENNYSLLPALRIHNGVQKLSQSIYRITTDPQVVGTSYVLTASNIRDY